MDPIEELKARGSQGWASFVPLEAMTGTTAPHLVRHARIASGQKVLDVACGTGVVSLTAARLGAIVSGLDLAPALVSRAKENVALMKLSIDVQEGDAEALPYADGSFDVVVSQFGHIFAPRSAVVMKEMLRVLRPGGTIAFSTWPPELFVGRMFELLGRYSPPPPPGVSSPQSWGDPTIVRERLGDAVVDMVFDRAVMRYPALSPQHVRVFNEQHLGPLCGLVAALEANAPDKLTALRAELDALTTLYFRDNVLWQDFLLTRATKR